MKKLIIYLILPLLFFNCSGLQKDKEYKIEILAAKDKNSNDYLFAFKSGISNEVTFGVYSIFEVGDTIHLVKYKSERRWEINRNKLKQ